VTEETKRRVIAERLHGFLHRTAEELECEVDYVMWMSFYIVGKLLLQDGPDIFLKCLSAVIMPDDEQEA
jgi:hypothetical protein